MRERCSGAAGSVRLWLIPLLLICSLGGVCSAQVTAPGTPSAGSVDNRQPMTKDEAKELFRSVDDILEFVSKDSKLPIEHSVKRKLLSRGQVNKFLRAKFDEDQGAKRMQRDEIVLKKFGLLDRDFQLRPFLLALLTEQIAGFYDNKTRTVNLLDWIAPDQQKPVLAHELTHALQDQKVDLTKWSDVSLSDTSRTVADDNRHLELDEADTARSAVAEGQAMVTFIDYLLRPTGKTIVDAPDAAQKLRESAAEAAGSPVMARAPLLLQQSLLFPYSDGLNFEQTVLVKKGVEAAFSGVLGNPPSSSYEIMNPEVYMVHGPVPVLRLPDLHTLLDAEYAPYDLGVMGELDVRILTELFGGPEIAQALAPDWAGGVYYAAQRRSATAAEKETPASLGLLYYSRWKNRDSARSFLRVYGGQLSRKYKTVSRRAKDEADDSEQIYSTNEGDVLLSMSGRDVFVSEGFSLQLARQLRASIAEAQGVGSVQTAQVPRHELSFRVSRELAAFGIPKSAMFKGFTHRGAEGSAASR